MKVKKGFVSLSGTYVRATLGVVVSIGIVVPFMKVVECSSVHVILLYLYVAGRQIQV